MLKKNWEGIVRNEQWGKFSKGSCMNSVGFQW